MSSAAVAPTSTINTLYLIVIQVVSRGLTFVGNQALLRYVQPRHLGLAVQLEALSISILYTSRESLRVALQRTPVRHPNKSTSNATARSSQTSVNVAWLVVVLGLALDVAFTKSYNLTANQELLESQDFLMAFRLYNVATVLELLSEPCFVIIQQHSLFKNRARAETSAAIVKCISSCIGAVVMNMKGMPMSVLPFAIGQVSYGLTLLLIYVWSVREVRASHNFSLLPSKVGNSPEIIFERFPRPLLALAGAFYGQSVFKWLLTQGDTLVLSVFAGLEAQGIFALASNYGGLASRLLFQPIEESSRTYFGALLTTVQKSQVAAPKSPRMSPEIVQKRAEALEYLSRMLRAYMIVITIPCCTLLTQIFPIIIQGLLGSGSAWKSTQTAGLLSAYSYYIPCLAINGILDAFVTSVATEAELGVQSLMMVGVTMIYLSAAYFGMTVLGYGAVGLVYANILNMLLRIIFSVWFISVWIEGSMPDYKLKSKPSVFRKFIRNSLPTPTAISMALLAFLTMQARPYIKSSLSHTTIVASLTQRRLGILNLDAFDANFIVTVSVQIATAILLSEREFLVDLVVPLIPARIRDRIRLQLSAKPTSKTQ